ncbi:MAG: AAA family ATPase [bacterium]
MDKLNVEGIELILSNPDKFETNWIGQEEVMEQLLACWLVTDKDDLPLSPRLLGKPGLGKTTLAVAAAKRLKKQIYIYQCTMDTRPEDLIITPVISGKGNINYHASSLVSAMVTGGIAILDEANRMSEKSWASLAPLLDNRRYVESIIAGIKIYSHPEFRCCVTMNDDASTYEIPDYIISRLQPMIQLEFPEKEEEQAILKYNLPSAPEEIIALTVGFLQDRHSYSLYYSTRDGINIIRYALKLMEANKNISLKEAFEKSVSQILGKEALDPTKKTTVNPNSYPNFSLLKDFFTNDGEWPTQVGDT